MRLISELVHDSKVMPSLGDLAHACQLSRRHLMRAFRQETGQTVGEFVRYRAIDKAMKLLRDTDQPIATIATEVGFSSPSAFSSAFRRVTGESPRKYRVNQRAMTITTGAPQSN